MPTGIITGASRGLGLALARALAADGWTLVIDGRDAGALAAAARELGDDVTAIAGDVGHRAHRRELVAAAGDRIDLLVNNASALGASPMPALADFPLDAFAHVYAINVYAPLELIQLAGRRMPDGATIVNVTSDAAVEPYEGWGGYGSSKAALEQLTAVLAAEQPQRRVYAVDPGDMDTQLHRDAEPGEDLSHLPKPEAVVPALLALLRGDRPSGRYRAHDLLAEVPA